MLIIIPARKGSTRLPGKNVRTFETVNGIKHNIVTRTILQATELEGTIVVTSDISRNDLLGNIVPQNTDFDAEPNEFELSFGGRTKRMVFHDRSNKHYLNTTETSSEMVVEDVLPYFNEDSFCLLQPTSPIRDMKEVVKTQRMFLGSDMPALISLNEMYQPNGSFYFVRTKDFMEQHSIYVKGASFIMCKGRNNIDINYIHEFRIAQAANEHHIYGDDVE